MHRLRSAIVSLAGCLLLGLTACVTPEPFPRMFRSVFVADPLGAPSADLAQCGDAIHDTAVRTLMARGYVAATEPAQADVILRSAWSARPATVGHLGGKVSLRLRIEDHSGRVLRSFDVFVEAPAGLLTKDRVSEAVRASLSAIETAPQTN